MWCTVVFNERATLVGLKTIQVDASKDCYMVLNDLVSEQVCYGPQSMCATANHRGL